MTVSGPVDATTLGIVLPHEHLFIDQLKEYRGDGLLNDIGLAKKELNEFISFGGRTLVDCCSMRGRNLEWSRSLAQELNINIVAGCGFYRVPYIDSDWVDRHSVEELAEGIVREVMEGIDGTTVRAGIIGEIGCDAFVTAIEERCMRAAARAQLETGLTIMVHAARWPIGLRILDVLEHEGVDPRRVIRRSLRHRAGPCLPSKDRGAWRICRIRHDPHIVRL